MEKKRFAECPLSGTRQICGLPSVKPRTLDKRFATSAIRVSEMKLSHWFKLLSMDPSPPPLSLSLSIPPTIFQPATAFRRAAGSSVRAAGARGRRAGRRGSGKQTNGVPYHEIVRCTYRRGYSLQVQRDKEMLCTPACTGSGMTTLARTRTRRAWGGGGVHGMACRSICANTRLACGLEYVYPMCAQHFRPLFMAFPRLLFPFPFFVFSVACIGLGDG